MIKSVEKAFLILDTISKRGDWVGVREISRLTGLKPATAQQLLKTLEKINYLEFDDKRRQYRIGIAAILLGNYYDRTKLLDDFCMPYIRGLHEKFGETVVVLTESCGVFSAVCWLQGRKELTVAVPGVRIISEPHRTASGSVLLANKSDEFLENYIKEKRLKDKKGFIYRMSRIRSENLAELVDFESSGVAAYGVGVRDSSGKAIISLGLSVPLVRLDGELRDKIIYSLKNTSQIMEAKLGRKI